MTGRKKVEIDLEHFQEAFMRVNGVLRDLGPAMIQMQNVVRELNMAMHYLLEATQLDPEENNE